MTIQQLKQMGLLDNHNGTTPHRVELIPQNMGVVLTSSAKDDVPTDEDGRRFTVFYIDEAHCIPEGMISPGDVLSIAGEAANYVAQGAPTHDYHRQNRHERRKWAKLRRKR